MPIPGTTKISHLEENLRAVDISFTDEEWNELENVIFSILIIGDRYNEEEQKKVNN